MKKNTKKKPFQFAYKVMQADAAHQHKLGTVSLVQDWLGKQYAFTSYDQATMQFGEYMTVRYLGRVTARTERGKIRQILALPGTSHLRRKTA